MFISASTGGAAYSAPSKLQMTANGEYTAASVAVNPNEAINMLLTRLKDGNYAALNSPLARSSTSVQSALAGLVLGG